MSKLDDIFAYYGDSVDSQGWMTDELDIAKQQIKNLILELIGDDANFRATEDLLDRGVQIGYNTLRAELRQKVDDL